MVPRKWVIGVSSALIVVLLFAGFMAVAAELGGKDDPLVSISYIEQLVPKLNQTIEEELNKRISEFDATIASRIADVNTSIDDKISRFEEQYAAGFTDAQFVQRVAEAVISSGGVSSQGDGDSVVVSGGEGAVFAVVDIPSGKTAVLDIGTEVLWRIGTATCYATSSPGLIDITTGEDLASGKQLVQNHVYVSTVSGRGFTATSNCKVLIKGGFTIQ